MQKFRPLSLQSQLYAISVSQQFDLWTTPFAFRNFFS